MSIVISTDSTILSVALLLSITVFPVKIGAVLFGAINQEFKYCLIAVFIATGIAAGILSQIDGFIGFLLSFIGVSFVYSKTLGLSIKWACLFTVGVFVIQIGILQAYYTIFS